MTKDIWESNEEGPGRVRVIVRGIAHPLYVDSAGLSDIELTTRIMRVVETRLVQEEFKQTKIALERVEKALLSFKQPVPSTIAPPAMAEAFLSIFMPKRFSEAQLGDMQEIFEANVERHGLSRATRLYWYEVARSIVPITFHWLKRIGIVAVLVDYSRKKIGL